MGLPDVRALIEEKAKAAEEGDFFDVLGIPDDASKAVVQKAYFDLAKLLHPDRLAKHNAADLKSKAQQAFKAVSDAYATLMDDSKRAELAARRKKPLTHSSRSEPHPSGILNRSTQELLRANPTDLGTNPQEAAKVFYHKGTLLMRKGAWDQAVPFFRKALEIEPTNARYQRDLGWSVFMDTSLPVSERMTEAKYFLESAIKTDAENPEGNYYVARYYKEAGKLDLARKHLETAVKLKQNYTEALRELRLLEMRSGKEPGGGGKSGGGSGLSMEIKWPFGLDKFFKKAK